MRVAIVTILFSSYLFSLPAQAGAWLRDQGRGFAALSYGATTDHEAEGSFYYEYGFTAQTTLGFDAAYARVPGKPKSGHATLFLRRALRDHNQPAKLSYELGLGVTRAMGIETAHVKTGLLWGRGLTLADRSGWLSLSTSALWNLGDDADVYKFEGTLGLKLTELTTGIFEINVSHKDGETSGRFEPAILITPRHDTFQIKFGTSSPFDDLDRTALKVGIWRSF